MKVTNEIRSNVFKAAWTIANREEVCISYALKRAWAWAKKNLLVARPEHFVIFGEQIKTTAKAICLEVGDRYKVWVPKSLVLQAIEDKTVVPSWFADKNLQDICGLFGRYATLTI